ncbi:MAG: metallophosphoesterase family protein [Phycisphaerae bacterium]
MHRYAPLLSWGVLLAAVTLALPASADEPRNLLHEAQWHVREESEGVMSAWTAFELDDPSTIAGLELAHSLRPGGDPQFVLNGTELAGPIDGVFYRVIPAIDPARLKAGRNMLVLRYSPSAGAGGDAKSWSPEGQVALTALLSEHLGFRAGPMLGECGPDYFTVVAETNLPALAVLRGEIITEENTDDGKSQTMFINISSGRDRHHWRIENLPEDWKVRYTVTVQHYQWNADVAEKRAVSSGWRTISSYPTSRPLRFVVCGNTDLGGDTWSDMVRAIAAARPDLFVHCGNITSDGRDDWLLKSRFLARAGGLFATVPLYAVPGPAEADSPLYDEWFASHQDQAGRNWTQTIGPVRLIGIDAAADWSPDGENIGWLRETLAGDGNEKSPRFTFVVSHYPAGPGARQSDDEQAEKALSAMREVVAPLLSEHGVTALVAGHDRLYDRRELGGGLTQITCGGAGLAGKPSQQEQTGDDDGVVRFHGPHYLVFTVSEKACRMEAVTPDGQVLDTKVWRTP